MIVYTPVQLSMLLQQRLPDLRPGDLGCLLLTYPIPATQESRLVTCVYNAVLIVNTHLNPHVF